MTGFEITCINRGTDGTIVRIGGAGWALGLHEAITKLITGQIRFYVYVEGRSWDIGVRGEGSASYLALEPDGFPLHEVATVPSC